LPLSVLAYAAPSLFLLEISFISAFSLFKEFESSTSVIIWFSVVSCGIPCGVSWVIWVSICSELFKSCADTAPTVTNSNSSVIARNKWFLEEVIV
jgi:hypothetical protein